MRTSFKFAVLLVLAAADLQAQTSTFRPGTVVEVNGIRGDAVSSSPSLIVLRTDHGLDSIPIAAIRDWRWQGTHVATGAKIGSITGAISVGLLGVAFSGLCESDCGSAATNGLLVGAGIGTVLGAGAGAIIGSVFQKWSEERGSTPVVAESRLAKSPVHVYITQGTSTTQAGAQFTLGKTRIGLEGARLDLGQGFTSYAVGDPSDPRSRVTAETIRAGRQGGVVVEQQLVGDFWAIGSVMRRSTTETTTTRDWRNGTGPDFSHPLVTTTSRSAAIFRGDIGLVFRHRVFDDIYFRADARIHSLTAGIEI